MPNNTRVKVTGTHYLGEITAESQDFLIDSSKLEKALSPLISFFNLTELGTLFVKFDGGGYTGTVVLAESHIAIHTWPEYGFLTLDVHICNYTRDNSAVCEKVFDAIAALFDPVDIQKRFVYR